MKPNAFLAFSIAAAFCSTAAIVALAAAGVMPGHDDKKKLIGLQNRFTSLFEAELKKKPDEGSFHWTRAVRDVAYERVQLPPAPQVSTSNRPAEGSAPAPQRVPATQELKKAVDEWFEKALAGALPREQLNRALQVADGPDVVLRLEKPQSH